MSEPVCDNCDCKSGLIVINLQTIRNPHKLTLCKECFEEFKMMVDALAEGNEGETVIV